MARELHEAPTSHRLLQIGAVFLASATACVAFGRVFVGATSTPKLLLAALISIGLAALFERRSPLLAALVSAVGLLWVIGIMVFPDSLWHGLPLGRTVHAVGRALGRVGHQADVQVAPTPPLDPLFMAALTAVWTAAFSTHALAVRSGSPLLAAVPQAALVGFTGIVMEDGPKPGFAVLFLLGVMALLFADGLRRVRQWGPVRPWTSGFERGRRRIIPTTATRGARRVAIVAVGAALLLPGLLPGFGSKPVLDVGAASDNGSIDPLVAVSASLKQGNPVPLFTVRTRQRTAVYWRWLSLDRFDGDRWTSNDVRVDRGRTFASGESLPVQDLDLPATTKPGKVAIISHQVITMIHPPGDWLPAAFEPVSFELQTRGRLRFDPDHTAAVPADDVEPGFTYSVDSRIVTPTYEQLNRPFDFSGPLYAADVQLPQDMPPEVAELAQVIVERSGATTPLQEALAVQHYLTSDVFTYDTSVPEGDGKGALLDFLTSTHRGFCQQFAASMAVLMRSLGIPARVAVGFTTGRYDPAAGEFEVTSDNAHSWVEVQFPGFGWLPFEPTPSRGNAVTDRLSTPSRSGSVGPTGKCTPQQFDRGDCDPNTGKTRRAGGSSGGRTGNGGSPRVQPTGGIDIGPIDIGTPTQPASPGTPLSWRIVVLLLLVILAAAVLLVLPAYKIVARRVRAARARTARDRALAAYRLFDARAGDVGLGRWIGETPQEYRDRLAAQVTLSDGHLDLLTRIVSTAAYAPRDVTDHDAAEAGLAARTAIRDVRRSAGLARRITGLWRPSI